MSEELELQFKRFSKDKQEQIRQLVSFATLMGLSGKDLVSIGGKLDRIEKSQDRKQRLAVTKEYNIQSIGQHKLHERFKLKINDVTYHFVHDYYGSWTVRNTATKKSMAVYPEQHDWGQIIWSKRAVNNILWELHQGKVTLP